MTESTPLVPQNSLLTKTPEEGRQLALKMSKLIILEHLEDAEAREKIISTYQQDPNMLIAIGKNVAIECAIIASANNYWKKF